VQVQQHSNCQTVFSIWFLKEILEGFIETIPDQRKPEEIAGETVQKFICN
jgi:DNA-binding ferritin-like protein (Dps family)